MAIFTRLGRIPGDSTMTSLATMGQAGSDVALERSDIVQVSGALSYSSELSFVSLADGSSRMVSRSPQARQLVITFACGDYTGMDQEKIRSFFQWDRPIHYSDSERRIEEDLVVISVDDRVFQGADSIQITCQTAFPATQDSKTISLGSGTGTSISLTKQTPGTLPVEGEVVVTLMKSSSSPWTGTVRITKGGSGFSVALEGQAFEERLSSISEILYGAGHIVLDASSPTSFWSVAPSEKASVSITATGLPANTAWSVDLVATAAKGVKDIS